MFTKFDNFWQKDSHDNKIRQVSLIFNLTYFMSTPYRVKHKCCKLLHNAELFSK